MLTSNAHSVRACELYQIIRDIKEFSKTNMLAILKLGIGHLPAPSAQDVTLTGGAPEPGPEQAANRVLP